MVGYSYLDKLQEEVYKVRLLPNHKNNIEYRDNQYDKYSHLFPIDFIRLAQYSGDELQDILIAYQNYIRKDLIRVFTTQSTKIMESDLSNFLNTKISTAYDPKTKELRNNPVGREYLKDYLRDIFYKTKRKTDFYSNPLDCLDNVRHIHKSIFLSIYFHKDNTTFSIARIVQYIKNSYNLGVVQNFRPLSSAVIIDRYAIQPNKTKKDITIICPSEGFFGRLLSTYYIAQLYPNHNIYYHTIDPNATLQEPFHKFCLKLKNLTPLFPIANWFPHFYCFGSETPRANFKETMNLEADLIWTSPPYFETELYVSSVDMLLTRTKDFDLNHKFITTLQPQSKEHQLLQLEKTLEIDKLKVGDTYTHNNDNYTILKISNDVQSHSIANSIEGWNELFFRCTCKNMFNSLRLGGYMCWNVANTRPHPTLGQDVVRICKEEGLTHIDTIFYSLPRRPANQSVKPPYEPVFVFQKKGQK